MGLAEQPGSADGADEEPTPRPHDLPDHFAALYDECLDEVSEYADERGVTLSQVADAHSAIIDGDQRLTRHDDMIEHTGMDYHASRQSAAVLSDIGGVHEAYDDDWNLWWVRCSERIADMCEDRRISLYRYYEMEPELRDFQDQVIMWYTRRNRRQQQPWTLTSLKEKYVHRIQRWFFPSKPVGDSVRWVHDADDGDVVRYREETGLYVPTSWSRHIAARYVRTAQDEIIEAYELTY